MIDDPAKIVLSVNGDDSIVSANISVSLGLIVTELVMNALKHAFPSQRGGAIRVDYRSTGPAWTLSVTDDGVGMSAVGLIGQPGLGASLVEAISKRLGAVVTISDEEPGTKITISHA
jgi:two-component sensor histidine kinase